MAINVCEHGHLKRSCEICELKSRIVDLERENEHLRGNAKFALFNFKTILEVFPEIEQKASLLVVEIRCALGGCDDEKETTK